MNIEARIQEQAVSEAFSRQSVVFDNVYENNSITLWMRKKVRGEVLRHIRPGDEMMELNCGTGIDTVFFAQQGFKVFATDNSDGMLQKLSQKVDEQNLSHRVRFQKCSFNHLDRISGKTFDYIFSNFGGLNCTDDLSAVLAGVDTLLKPGGQFTFVIMPKVCPWELMMLLRGRPQTAFRRFKKNGASAHIEGVYFRCYYYNPSEVLKLLPDYKLMALKGLSSLVPPPFMDHFPAKYPRFYRTLVSAENKVCDQFPFNRWCDQYAITMRKPG